MNVKPSVKRKELNHQLKEARIMYNRYLTTVTELELELAEHSKKLLIALKMIENIKACKRKLSKLQPRLIRVSAGSTKEHQSSINA